MSHFLHDLARQLRSGRPLALASVAESSGSTPRSAGARMAVDAQGRLSGTVGGGLLEHLACAEAARLLDAPGEAARLLDFDLSNTDAAGTDMICGGRLTVLLERLDPGGPAATAYLEAERRLGAGEPAALLTLLAGDGPAPAALALALDPAAAPPLVPGFSPGETAALLSEARGSGGLRLLRRGAARLLAQAFGADPPLVLFGAGHISQFTAHLGALAGFRVTVLDDRAEYANAQRFPDAARVLVLGSFSGDWGLDIGPDAYLAILTRGHLHDHAVLERALRTPARYIGMIGSRRKRDAIYAVLRQSGFSDADLARCHSPIGLDIGAQTPEEIAVSILAELIAVRAGKAS